MRRVHALAVSSALLFLSIMPAPCHEQAVHAASSADMGSAKLLISEFYPCALSEDEYFVISSNSQTDMNLRNWSVTDGEGRLSFRNDYWVPAMGSVTISRNSSSFLRAFAIYPDIGLDLPNSSRLVGESGSFRLADTGDSVALVSPTSATVDFVAYGKPTESSILWSGSPVPVLRQGEVARRAHPGSSWQDSDSAQDWEPFREFKLGYTEFESISAAVRRGCLEAFVSPDCSLEVITDAIRNARSTIRVCSYELSSASVCLELLRATERGVRVAVLVDGAPTGGMSDRQVQCLSALASKGVDVATVNGNLSRKIVQHVGAFHAKYMVIDSTTSIILSENFVEAGVPVDKIIGNRGWGARISDPQIAGFLSAVFDSDGRLSRLDVVPWRMDPRFSTSFSVPEVPTANHTMGAQQPLVSTTDAKATIIVSPDGSSSEPYLCPIIRTVRTLDIEQFQVGLWWEPRWTPNQAIDPLLTNIVSAMREGAEAKMLFDSSWFNAEGNGPAVAYMVSACANESLRGEFKLMNPKNPITVVHNKGAIMDDQLTLISRNNWGFSSFAKNREIALLLDSPEIAGYFHRTFDFDWTEDDSPPHADAGSDATLAPGEVLVLDGTRSSDDRVIAHYEWDMDSDGVFETKGSQARFVSDRPGVSRVWLRVEDGWGNKDSAQVNVTVLQPKNPSFGSGRLLGMKVLVLPFAAGSGLALGIGLARRRNSLSRKINHPPAS